MPLVTVKHAEMLTGKSRQTLWRDSRKGKISVHKDKQGNNLYDPSELERAYGTLQQVNSNNDVAMLPDETSINSGLLQQENRFLQEKITDLETQLKKAYEREEKLQLANDKLSDAITHQTRLIEHQAQTHNKGFFKRMFG
jgi:hypothetical protein